ncbi:hypothetical protein OBV_27390 [Oscillibacter valericigenes Sjm18-20]|nr:hypothetical protein OBV_20050 [Oscillibacter valericigenes Sjm18-20]BAK99937.1 hypothetical protein OBV_27390 [Oscillibacter valericigenes Sjm18-20]
MERICEALKHTVAMAPASVAASTETATSYLSAIGMPEVEFLVSTGAIASGKKLTVALYAAEDPDGANAVKVAEKTFTASVDMDSAVAVISARVTADRGGYYAVKFQHDCAAAVICAVTMSGPVRYRPAKNDWTLVI